MKRISKANWHMFSSAGIRPYHRIRWGIARPRVHGGYAIMVKRLIITPTLDEVEVYQSVR